MGTIREYKKKDGSATFHAEVRLKGQKPQRACFRTRTQAKQWVQATESAIRDGRYVNVSESRRRTVTDMIERFIEKWLPKYPGRMKKQVALLTWWKEQCGHLLLNELTASVIADCRDRLLSENTVRGSQRSPATVNRYLSSLGKALTVAVKEWEWLDDTPMRKVSKPRESTGRDRFLSEIEKVNLLRECMASRNHNLYPMVALSLITGARYSELAGLRWENIFFDTRIIVFRKTKNGEDRKIPLTTEAEWIFKQLYNGQPFTDLVFQSKKPDRKNQIVNVREAFEAALKRAEIRNFTWHDLRHTAASYLAMNGATQGELMTLLGHKSPAMTKRYAHFSQDHLALLMSRNSQKIIKIEQEVQDDYNTGQICR